MKKLFNLKQWLTVPDAARHLAILFGEEVSEADVLRLALDGHLSLSQLDRRSQANDAVDHC